MWKLLGVVALVLSSFIALAVLASYAQRPLVPVRVGKSVPAYVPQAGPVPRFVTYHLGTVHLTSPDKWPKGNDYSGLYDAAQNYSLQDGDGPDGCEYVLSLQPGSNWNMAESELREAFRGVHVRLITGRSVLIGDTPQQVEKKIGAPTLINRSSPDVDDGRPQKNHLRYTYIYRGKRLYTAHYDFEAGKLIAIFFREARPPSAHTGLNGGCP